MVFFVRKLYTILVMATPNSEQTVTATTDSVKATPPKRSTICHICNKEMYHEKALYGHRRWHTSEERELARQVASEDATSVVVGANEGEGSSKRMEIPDLNHPPPSDDLDA